MVTQSNKVIAVILVIALIAALGVFIYVNLSKQTSTPSGGTAPKTPLLTVSYNGNQWNYTLIELKDLPVMTGSGSYIKLKLLPSVNINGPYNFTGVNIAVLLDSIQNLPSNYSVISTSSDNYTFTYTYDQVHGNVDVYDASGNPTGNNDVVMLLAYQQDGHDITDPTIGPLRIVFVDHGAITSSSLWSKSVVSLEIVR